MQCVSCRFENTPDSDNCCRCGTMLQLDRLAVDVHPPRAKKWNKPLRRLFPNLGIARYWGAIRRSFSNKIDIQERFEFPFSLLLRGMIPGGAHFYLGQRRRGWTFLLAFLFFLTMGILQFGTFWGNVCLGLCFSVHASSLMSLIQQQQAGDWLGRLIRGYAVVIALGVLVYIPMAWLVSHLASPRIINIPAPPLQEGDVYLCNYWTYSLHKPPQRGHLVLYRGNGGNGVAVQPPNQQYNIQAGERIDRVVAIAGDRVVSKKGSLLVNGSPAEHLPLNPAIIRQDFDFIVAEHCVCIFPSTLYNNRYRIVNIANLITVPIEQVDARVYFQLRPLWQFGFVH